MHGYDWMHEELVDKLREKFGAGLEEEISGQIASFGGLLTRHAAVLLLCRKNGVDIERKIPLSQAPSMRLPFSFEAKIVQIFPAQSYAGRSSRSVRVHLSDGSTEATLVLWNEQVREIESGGMHAGDCILCSGAYTRSDEITLARGGSVQKLKSAPVSQLSSLAVGICSIEGTVEKIEPDHEYADRKTGEKKTLSSFVISGAPGLGVRVVAWSKPQGMKNLVPGDQLLLENVVFKNSELHFNSQSRMTLLNGKVGETAIVEKIEVGENDTLFVLDGREFRVKNGDAARLIGLPQILPGVSARTVIGIKAQELAGKKAGFCVEDGKLRSLSF